MVFRKLKKASAALLITAMASLYLAGGAMAAELPETLVPVGEAVGISIKTQGVMVSEISELDTDDGKVSPARDAGILPGDVIMMVNGKEISTVADLMESLEGVEGESVPVQISRDGSARQVTVRPYFDGSDSYLGVWVRDGLTGIGTVTYYDPQSGTFGALGHSIADSATGVIVPLKEGEIMSAEVTGITKSRAGAPGQLGGTFDYDSVLGEIKKNCGVGIFGTMTGETGYSGGVPTAARGDIKTGSAVMISDVSGEPCEYDIEITRLYQSDCGGRDMMIKVTDGDLISITGGIVQGMSGSPIIQDGKLVGAVTHVLINDPTKGYGVSIENMFSES